MDNLRPCVFKTKDGEEGSGYFHTWEQRSAGKFAFIKAVIEKENGKVITVFPHEITFTDRTKENYYE